MKVKRMNNLFNVAGIVFLTVVFASVTSGQAVTDAEQWTRLTMDNGEFSILMPAGLVVDAEKRDDSRYRLFGFKNGVSITVKVSRQKDGKTRLSRVRVSDVGTTSSFTKGKITGKRFSSDKGLPYFREKIFLASDNHFYIIELKSGDRSKQEISFFMNSLNLEGQPIFVPNGQIPMIGDEVKFEALKTSSEIVDAFARKPKGKKVQMIRKNPQDLSSRYQYDGLSRTAIIVDEPRFVPTGIFSPTDGLASGRIERSAILEVTLRADGTIGDITAYSNADKAYLEACRTAAQKIKFIPAQVNGQNVDTKVIIDYSLVGIFESTVVVTPSVVR